MDAMVEALQGIVIAEPETEVQPDPTEPDDGTIESQLTEEICNLWSDHVRLSGDRKVTGKELRQIRASLAERLHEMKSLLSRPGRGGKWHSWLRERHIPRSTADRLVARHAETLGIEDGNAPSEAISEPPTDTAEKLAKGVWLRLRKVLVTDESVIQFIACIVTVSGVGHEQRAEGLVIFKPAPIAAEELSGTASAIDPAPQPSDEASAIAEEPRDETAAPFPTTEQVAGAASSGDVV